MTALATVANIASGTARPGLARFHSAIAMIMIAHQIHDPATTINQADVEECASGQRRVERVEHRRPAGENGDHRHHRADEADGETEPSPREPWDGSPQRGFGDQVAEPHHEKR